MCRRKDAGCFTRKGNAMSLMNLSRVFSLCLTISAVPALAGESAVKISGQTVRLDCPAGTVQNTTKVSKDMAAFCKKTGTEQEGGKEPVAHGPYVAFWANGQKQAEGQNKDGFRSGIWTFWDESGAKTGETEFVRGNYHATRVEFYANGKKKTEEQWNNGTREGISVAYSEDGQKVAERHYAAGKVVKETAFENGKPVASK